MAWTATFKQDTDTPGVGTVTATDSVSGATFSREQVNTNNATKVNQLVAAAKAKAAELVATKAAEQAIADSIAAKLNS